MYKKVSRQYRVYGIKYVFWAFAFLQHFSFCRTWFVTFSIWRGLFFFSEKTRPAGVPSSKGAGPPEEGLEARCLTYTPRF